MSQIIRATVSPVVPAHGKIRKVARSGRRYMSDSSIRTNPSIDEPSNMMWPSSASSNCRSGTSTFLIAPRISVNWRRMNLTLSRSMRSISSAFRSCVPMPELWPNFSGPPAVRERSKRKPGAESESIDRRFLPMRMSDAAGLAAVGVVVSAFVFAPVMRGQGKPDGERNVERRIRMLDGRGSAIGVSIRDLNADEATKARLPQAGGVLVQEVEDGSPAAKAGIRANDVIVEFDGERVRSARNFTRLVQETADGRTVKATIVRNGARQTVDVTPAASGRPFAGDIVLPDIQREIERAMRAIPRHFSFDFDVHCMLRGTPMFARGRLGITGTTLTDQLAAYFKVKEGVLVSSVAPDSPAEKAGLKAGDVITSVNGRTVDDLRDLTERLRDAK